jgi:hypothetical protein
MAAGQHVCIVKVKAHTGKADADSLGNAAADAPAYHGRLQAAAPAGTGFARYSNVVVLGEGCRRLEHDAKALSKTMTLAGCLQRRNRHEQGAGFLSTSLVGPACMLGPTLDPVSELELSAERNSQQMQPSKFRARQDGLPLIAVWPWWRPEGRRTFVAAYGSMPTNHYLSRLGLPDVLPLCACGLAEGTNHHQMRECMHPVPGRARRSERSVRPGDHPAGLPTYCHDGWS